MEYHHFATDLNDRNPTSLLNRCSSLRTIDSDSQSDVSFSESIETIRELLLCNLCSDRISDAQMCPQCYKMYCFQCIIRRIRTEAEKCPNCSVNLSCDMLLDCSAMCDQLSQVQRSHKVLPFALDEDYAQAQAPASLQNIETAKKLDNRSVELQITSPPILCDLEQFDLSLQQGSLYVEKTMQTCYSQLSNSVTDYQDKVGRISNELSGVYSRFHQKMSKHLAVLEQQYDQHQNLLRRANKVQLVRDFVRKTEQISHLRASIPKDILQNPQGKLPDPLIPEYSSKVFALPNFSYYKEPFMHLYSESMYWRGNEWKLKIYPNGIDAENEGYLGVYLEMAKASVSMRPSGSPFLNRCKFSIELVHPSLPKQNIMKEYEAQFEENVCWGYDSFVNIKETFLDGFLANNTLVLRLSVRYASFYHAIQEQELRMEEKQANLARNNNTLQKLIDECRSKGIDFADKNKNGNPSNLLERCRSTEVIRS